MSFFGHLVSLAVRVFCGFGSTFEHSKNNFWIFFCVVVPTHWRDSDEDCDALYRYCVLGELFDFVKHVIRDFHFTKAARTTYGSRPRFFAVANGSICTVLFSSTHVCIPVV